jgi:hypothetical protein
MCRRQGNDNGERLVQASKGLRTDQQTGGHTDILSEESLVVSVFGGRYL